MLALPPVVGWHNQIRLGRDYYVRIAGNDYSVDPTAIGRIVEAHADLDRVQVRLGEQLVREHPRVWARSLTVTNPAHVGDRPPTAAPGPTAPPPPTGRRPADAGLGRLRQGVRYRHRRDLMMATNTDQIPQAADLAGRRLESTPDPRVRRPAR